MKTRTAIIAMLLCAPWPVSGVEATPEVPLSAPQAPAPAKEDGLRRCVGANGGTIFTDRRCVDLQAVEAPESGTAGQPAAAVVRVRSCARNQDDLLAGVRAALENRDGNRLAEFYHWSGMGTAQGYHVLDRLTAFSQRPVVDVQLISSMAPPDDFSMPPMEPEDENESDSDSDSEFDADGVERVAPPVHRRHPADLLRVDQMRGEADLTAEVTYFHLLSNAGCWWMQF
jgi:hypothetical protein